MPKNSYTYQPTDAEKSARAKANNVRVHYKNTAEVGRAIRGMGLKKSQGYLKDVIEKKQIVPFRVHRRGGGRHAQMKHWKASTARWPQKSCRFFLNVLQNLEANAVKNGLDVDALTLTHVQVQAAAKGRRRTYRAHGRINPFMNCPAHIEVIAEEAAAVVPKPAELEGAAAAASIPRRRLAAKVNPRVYKTAGKSE